MRKATSALVALLLLAGSAPSQAASITIPGGGGFGPFGEPNTAYVGQTFQALPGLADKLTFPMSSFGGGADDVEFHVLIAEWDGYDPGVVLFESEDLSYPNDGGFVDFTVNLGGIDLIDGNTYVMVLDAFVLFDGSDGLSNLFCNYSNAYAGGDAVAYNAYGGDRASHFSEGSWSIYGGLDLQMTLTFTECGNAVVEVGEDCDDGNTAAGDCCSATCLYESTGSPCSDGNACTLEDFCDDGECIPGVAADCDDDDLCTVDSCNEVDGCHNDGIPVDDTACYQAGKSIVLVVDAAAKKMKWVWKKGDVVSAADLGTPDADTGYALCLFDHSAGTPELVGSYAVPASATAWTVKPAKVKYVDNTGAPDGITLAKAKALDLPGKSSLLMKGSGASLVLPAPSSPSEFFDLDASLKVQVLNDVGACWSTDFTAAKKNTATKFKAVMP